jgi:hypothetical protein
MRYKSNMMSIKTFILLCLALPLALAPACGNDPQPGDSDCGTGTCDEDPPLEELECPDGFCDPDPPIEQSECTSVSGPEYWGCLPPDFEEPVYGERCSLEEGFTFCFSQTPCICNSLTCHEGSWKNMSAFDISCGGSCDLARFEPDNPDDDSVCDM